MAAHRSLHDVPMVDNHPLLTMNCPNCLSPLGKPQKSPAWNGMPTSVVYCWSCNREWTIVNPPQKPKPEPVLEYCI